MKSRWVRVTGLAMAFGFAACAPALKADPPGPDRPVIRELRIDPARVISGCPFRLTFQFEDRHADVIAAWARWAHDRGGRVHDSGLVPLPIERLMLNGKTAGETSAVLRVQHPGRYWYAVQIEDAAGRRSNVVEEMVVVDAQPSTGPRACEAQEGPSPASSPPAQP